MLILKTVLRVRGFAWVIKWIRHRVQSVPVTTMVSPTAVTATAYAVAIAGALYPGRALCLEQSLVLYYLLRKQGVGVDYCLGVQPHPFLAHAWVEYRGEPLNDVAEHVTSFARLPTQLP
jgi:transglutaminase superfamily protein